MCETDDAKLSSTTLSASNLTVHRRYPAGASEQAKAISRASNAPSNIISRGGLTRDLRTRAASIPSSTKRFFKCSMVRLVIPSAAATSATLQAGPSARKRSHLDLTLSWVFLLYQIARSLCCLRKVSTFFSRSTRQSAWIRAADGAISSGRP